MAGLQEEEGGEEKNVTSQLQRQNAISTVLETKSIQELFAVSKMHF